MYFNDTECTVMTVMFSSTTHIHDDRMVMALCNEPWCRAIVILHLSSSTFNLCALRLSCKGISCLCSSCEASIAVIDRDFKL